MSLRLLISMGVLSSMGLMTFASWNFETTDPLQMLDSHYRVDRGIKVVRVDMKFISPCEFEADQEWTSTYDNKRKMYERLNQLCRNESDQVHEEFMKLAQCMPPVIGRPRKKRLVPILLAGAAGVLVIGGASAYRAWSPTSDLNRIRALEEGEKAVNASIKQLREDLIASQLSAAKDRVAIIDSVNSTLERTKDNKNAILEFVEFAPDLMWTASNLKIVLHDYREGLAEMASGCRNRRLSTGGLAKIVSIPELIDIEDSDTWIEEIRYIGENIITVSIHVNVRNTNASIYETVGIDHFANYTFAPTLVTYSGPSFALYDASHDCLKGISRPRQSPVYDTCDRENYRDPDLLKWDLVTGTDEEIKNRTKPLVLQTGDGNTIYCFYEKIKIASREYWCPAWPFRLPRNIGFKLGTHNYSVNSIHLKQQDRNIKIRTPILHNHTDIGYETDGEILLNLKHKHQTMIESGKLTFDKGTVTIPWEYVPAVGLGLVSLTAGLITIGQWVCKMCAGHRSGSVGEHDSHRESIKIYNSPPHPSSSQANEATLNKDDIILELLKAHLVQQAGRNNGKRYNGQAHLPPRPTKLPPSAPES